MALRDLLHIAYWDSPRLDQGVSATRLAGASIFGNLNRQTSRCSHAVSRPQA